MRSQINPSYSIRLFWSILVVLATTGSAHATEKGWVLLQDSDFYGLSKVQVCSNTIKVESRKLGLNLCTQAPKWTVNAVNNRSKMVHSASMADWQKQFTFSSHALKDKHKREIKRGKDGTIAGLKSTQYLLIDTSKGPSNVLEYWVARDIKVPPQAAQLIAAALDVPSNLGLPLRIIRTKHGHKVTMLDTLKSEPGQVDTALFQSPKNYKKASAYMDLMLQDSGGDMIESLMSKSATRSR